MEEETEGAAPKRGGNGRKTSLDHPRGPGMFLMLPEDVTVAGVDYAEDHADPLFDDRARMARNRSAPWWDTALVDDIATNGVRVPITVVKDDQGRIVVNAGRRRVLHAREANLRRAAAGQDLLRLKVIVDKGDAGVLFLMARRENAFRVQDGTLARARNAHRALHLFNRTMGEVGAAEGVTLKTVREWLQLLELAPEVHERIECGQVSAAAALTLRDLPRKDQVSKIKEMIAAGHANVTDAQHEREQRSKRKQRKQLKLGAGTAPAPEGDEDPVTPPRKGAIKKLLCYADELGGASALFPRDPDKREGFVLAVRWVLGDVSRKRVPGLSDALRTAGVKGLS